MTFLGAGQIAGLIALLIETGHLNPFPELCPLNDLRNAASLLLSMSSSDGFSSYRSNVLPAVKPPLLRMEFRRQRSGFSVPLSTCRTAAAWSFQRPRRSAGSICLHSA